MNPDADRMAHEARGVVEAARALLVGRDPAVQGAALVELAALYIAGHNPRLRQAIFDAHVDAIRDLVAIVAAELIPGGGWAGGVQ